jgi:hypothetical protein
VELEAFKEKQINHLYMDYLCVEYKQHLKGFEPNLSILDMLLNCGKVQTKVLLTDKNNYKFSDPNQKIDAIL